MLLPRARQPEFRLPCRGSAARQAVERVMGQRDVSAGQAAEVVAGCGAVAEPGQATGRLGHGHQVPEESLELVRGVAGSVVEELVEALPQVDACSARPAGCGDVVVAAHGAGRRRARTGRIAARSAAWPPAAARRGAVFSAVVRIRSAGVTSKMSHSADSTGRESRSGVPVTRRWTWEADRAIPRSASSGVRSVVLNMPC